MWCSFPAMLVNNSIKYFWVLMLCLASVATMGQQISAMFYKEVLLKHKRYTLQSITEEMQRQSGISFSYNAADIDPNTRIRIKGDRMTVAELLALIKKRTGISYKIISQTHIIYTAASDKKQGKKKSKKTHLKHRKAHKEKDDRTDEQNRETAPAEPSLKEGHTTTITDSATDATIVIVGDSGAVASYYGGGGGSGGGSNAGKKTTAKPISERKWRRGIVNNRYRGEHTSATKDVLNFFQNNTVLAFGASVDETYYLNPTLKFGMNFLYGLASYNMGNGQNCWRYGIGGSAKIDEHWSMHFVVTTGQSVSRDYSIPSPSLDTPILNTPLKATSRLMRYGVSTQYIFDNGFAIEGGLTFNSLKTSYTSNGSPVALSDVLPIGYDADQKYPGIKPPYTLGNTYTGNSTGNTKTWIGIQLTLLYHIRFSREL